MTIERRFLSEPVMVGEREREDGSKAITVEGYAARFDSLSHDLGGFRETIKPGAFRKALQGSDVRAYFNHDISFVLGRESSGTLRLREDKRGLWYSVDLPDTSFARDLAVSMRRGDIDGSSFAFTLGREGVDWDEQYSFEDGSRSELRTIVEVNSLEDVSVVTVPAYPAADARVRSLMGIEAALEERADIRNNRNRRRRAEADAWLMAQGFKE